MSELLAEIMSFYSNNVAIRKENTKKSLVVRTDAEKMPFIFRGYGIILVASCLKIQAIER